MIQVKQTSSVDYLVQLKGVHELTNDKALNLKENVKEIIGDQNNILIDLTGVEKIDGDGFSQLKSMFEFCEKGTCRIKFTGVDENIREILDSLALNTDC